MRVSGPKVVKLRSYGFISCEIENKISSIRLFQISVWQAAYILQVQLNIQYKTSNKNIKIIENVQSRNIIVLLAYYIVVESIISDIVTIIKSLKITQEI